MKKPEDHDEAAICTVTDMAKQLGLSRARFYQLVNAGVFPAPVYSLWTKRPFYSPALRRQCVKIRQTGIDLKGRPVLFNAPREDKQYPMPPDRRCERVRAILQGMGLPVSIARVRNAIAELYADGLTTDHDERVVARNVLFYLKGERQNAV